MTDDLAELRAALGDRYSVEREIGTGGMATVVVSAPIAAIYGALGDLDRAFEWLDRAFAERNWTLFFMRSDPMLAALRGDPRWGRAVARMAFPP